MDSYKEAKNAYYNAFFKIDVKENEKIVLESKDTNWCYEFAKNIPGADIKAHEQIILELKNGYYCFIFARDIPGADIEAHEKVILELKDLYCSYCFAKEIPEANIEEHFKLIYYSGNKQYLDWFIKDVKYKGSKVKEWLLYI